eukprot:1880581-Pleurochrysis_carterae.AAC.5
MLRRDLDNLRMLDSLGRTVPTHKSHIFCSLSAEALAVRIYRAGRVPCRRSGACGDAQHFRGRAGD